MGTDPASDPTHPWSLGSKRANNFDFLRFVLASVVVYSHSLALLCSDEYAARHDLFRRLTHGWANGGNLAVNGFLAISGLLVVQSYFNSGSAWAYLQKRVARIYPGFIVASLFCLLCVGPLAFDPPGRLWSAVSVPRYLLDTLNLRVENPPGAFPANPTHELNGSAWVLMIEFWFYLAVLLLGLVGLLRRPAILLGLFAASVLLYGAQQELHVRLLDHGDYFRGYIPIPFSGHWPRVGSFFLAGACCYFYGTRVPVNGRMLLTAAGFLAASCFLHRGYWLTLPLCGTHLLFAFAFSKRVQWHGFARRADLSYGVYLYSWPIQQLLVRFWKPHPDPHTLFVAALSLACACAWASWHWVEKPWLARKPRTGVPVSPSTFEGKARSAAGPVLAASGIAYQRDTSH